MKSINTRAIRATSIAALTLFLLQAARAEGVLLGDSFIASASPSLNFGGLPTVNVGPGSPGLLAFDLSLPAGTTASQIAKATLLLFANRVGSGGQMEIQPILSAWAEGTVTWANSPVLGGYGSGPTFSVAAAQQTVAVDVTALVKGWVSNPASNFGLALVPSAGSPNTVAYFDSKENTGTGRVARLDITLTGSSATAGGNLIMGPYGTDVCARDVTPTPGACPTGYTQVGIGSIAFTSSVFCQSDASGDVPRVKVAPLCAKN